MFGVAGAQVEPLVLDGNQSQIIEGTVQLSGFTVIGNASLVIQDAYIEMMDAQYTVNESASLTIINSTLTWQGSGGIRLLDDSRVEIKNSTIYMEYELGNRTYYGHGADKKAKRK